MGARLGGATKELLPNLDTYKNNEKSTIPLRFLFFGGCFGEANLLIFVRPSVRPSVRASGRPAVKIQVVIGVFLGTKNPEFRPDTFCAEHLQNARTCRYKPQKAFFWQQNFYKFWFLSKVRAIWHHTVTRVLSLGRPEFRRKFNLESKNMLSILANCRKYVDSACSFEKLQFDRKIFRSRVRRALTAASRYHPQFAFEAANGR